MLPTKPETPHCLFPSDPMLNEEWAEARTFQIPLEVAESTESPIHAKSDADAKAQPVETSCENTALAHP